MTTVFVEQLLALPRSDLAGAVLKTLSRLIKSVSQSVILFLKSSKHLHSQIVRAGDLKF